MALYFVKYNGKRAVGGRRAQGLPHREGGEHAHACSNAGVGPGYLRGAAAGAWRSSHSASQRSSTTPLWATGSCAVSKK